MATFGVIVNTLAMKGKAWSEDEVIQLLKEIQKKQTLEEIAPKHQRTVGGIRSRLREIAADYYTNDNLSIEQIMKFTGLPKEDIVDSISRREWKNSQMKETPKQESKKVQEPSVIPKSDNMKEVLIILKDIQQSLKILISLQQANHTP